MSPKLAAQKDPFYALKMLFHNNIGQSQIAQGLFVKALPSIAKTAS